MTYRIRVLENAQEDLDWLRKNDRTGYIKCFDLVREIMGRSLESKSRRGPLPLQSMFRMAFAIR